MATENDVLGISGQMDISDIQESLDKLDNNLNKIGVATDNLSQRATAAFQKISQSSDDAATKQQQAAGVLKQVNEEVLKLTEGLPEKIRQGQLELSNMAASIAKIKENLANATDSRSIAEYTAQLKSQSAAYETVKANVRSMQDAYSQANVVFSDVANAISVANGISTANVALTGAGAAAHAATTAAVGAETVAHGANAESILKEGEATKQATEASKEHSSETQDANEQLRAYTVTLSDYIQRIHEQEQAIADLKSRLGQSDVTGNSDEVAKLQHEIEIREQHLQTLKEQMQDFKENAKINTSSYERSQSESQAEVWAKQKEIGERYAQTVDDIRQRVAELLETYKQLPDANKNLINIIENDLKLTENNPSATDFANKPYLGQAVERLSDNEVKLQEAIKNRSETEKEADNIYKKGIDELNDELEKLIAKRKEIIGNVPNWLAEWNPNGIFGFDEGEKEKLDDINEAIRQKKEELKEAQEETRRLNEEEEKGANDNTYGQQQMSVSRLREEISKTDEEQRKLNEKLEELKGKEPTKKTTEEMDKLGKQIDDTKKKAEALNKELEGRSGISKGWASFKDSIGGFFKQFKSGLSAGGGGITGLFSMLTSTKALGWGAAIGGVTAAVKGLNDEAEKLHLAMNSLKPYVDDNTLGKLRQSFIDTALAGSAQSTEDMAAAATHWVRYYEQIRKTPAAIKEVVDASRELATLTGQTAEKSADQLTKIAGQYHLNAFEAKQAVNVITNATVKSTVSMTEMMSALQGTGQRAKQMGTSFKEMAAVIAMSSQNFPSASSAASSYLMVLQRLSRQTKDEYNPLVVGATKALENLNKAHLSGAQIQKMFGVRIANQARYFIDNASAISKYSQGLDSAKGKNAALARATQTAEYNQKALKSAMSALAQTINVNITPAIVTLIQGLVSIINSVSKGVQPIKNFFNTILKGIKEANDWIQSTLAGKLIMRALTNNPIGIALKLQLKGAETLTNNQNQTSKAVRQQELNGRIDEIYSSYRSKYPKASRQAITNMIENNLFGSKKRGYWGDFYYGDIRKAIAKQVSTNEELYNANINGFDFTPSKDNHVDDTKTKKNTAAEQQNRRDEQLAKERFKKEQENAQIELQLANLLEQNKIDAMTDGAEKQRKLSDLNHKKRLQQIKEQAQQYINANIEAQASEYANKHPTGKSKGFYAQGKISGVAIEGLEGNVSTITNPQGTAIGLNATQRKLIQAQIDSENLQFTEEEKKLEEQLIKSHQSYTDKKLEIDRQYKEDLAKIDAAIVEANTRDDKETSEALQRTRNQRITEYGKEKMQAAFDELKDSPEYVAAFTDIDKASTETLNNLVKRFEEVKEAAASSLNPQDAKTYFDTVNGLLDELISRDPVGMARKLTEELQQQEKELAIAQENLNAVRNGLPVIKNVGFDKNTGKFTVEMLSLADAENEVATKAQAVAHSQTNLDKANKKTLDYVENLINAFNELGNAIGGEAGQIIGLISDIANFAVSSANAMMSVSTTASKAIQTMEKASAILTIIATAISLMSKISSIFKTTDDYYEQYAKKQAEINKLREAVDEYRLSVIKARQEEKNWFSTTGLQDLQNAWEQHAQAEENYYNKLFEAQEVYKDKGSGFSKWGVPILTAAAAAVAGAFTFGTGAAAVLGVATSIGVAAAGAAAAAAGYTVASAAQSAYGKISYNSNQTAAINNLRIQTRHKSFWRGQKTADLRDWVRQNLTDDYGNPAELFDEQGLINLEVAKEVVDEYGDKLQGETKETLEKLIKLREQYDEYKQELQDYVSQTYSPLVDNMSDAIWEWLANGKDALQQFKDSASQTFASIGKEMIKQMLLKTVFDGFQDKLTALYDQYAQKNITDTQLVEQMGAIMGAMMDSFEQNLPALETFAEKYQDILSKYGFDVTGNTEQSASAKGVSTITYDQANFLVNLATARNIALEQGNAVRNLIQVDTTQIRITTLQIQTDISVMRDIQEQGLTQLTRIEANTRPISEILDVVNNLYRIVRDNA